MKCVAVLNCGETTDKDYCAVKLNSQSCIQNSNLTASGSIVYHDRIKLLTSSLHCQSGMWVSSSTRVTKVGSDTVITI